MTDKTLPAPQDFLLKVPLYQKITFSMLQAQDIVAIIYFKGTYDSYCMECKQSSTFQAITKDPPTGNYRAIIRDWLPSQVRIVSAYCTRAHKHLQYFVFLIGRCPTDNATEKITNGFTIQKIGQHPSYGDLNLPRFKKYTAILDKPKLRELNRAVGLASHDVGIGSYVYLRRVFEALIEEAHQVCASEAGWDDERYIRARMSEKIPLLKQRLPEFLVENPKMYSLLSKGVHELSEDECLNHFDTLRIGIELILDEKMERKEKEEKIKKAKSALSKAVSETQK